ncbi:hypothetical protein RFM41_24510 [Mesorhizobium sp. VK25A]|uniref:Large polyvalent protein associated domain-containing protein n=1 Tax=Mesorhizobium vachelliae TaxID=3072309 RepID=A0ABU5A9D0_9HYPH|nr:MULTISPECIES: hypothetical protein [unclassified Mesorhizobium]MDX8534290.1 hypothetical protein [Mesorhizobium sp. VK25D]MDX8546932.1 hypothetical protein [Mesorhizobium sp. VK25A]
MVHIIPILTGERRLDTGNAVQYPDSSPVGEAMQQLGDRWQAAAERYEQRKAQQQAFDTEIAARRLNGELAQAEAEAVANSPADGAGLHEAMYGQVDPYTGQVVKAGLFDTLFGNFLKQVPDEIRPGLVARKEAFRAVGGRRMAGQQNQRRKQYEQDQVAEVQTAELSNITQSDPNDTAAFDASRQAGLDLIAKMDLDPRAKALAEADWLARSAKARMQALIAQDPRRAAEMLSAGPVASDGMGETVRSQLAGGAQGKEAAAKGQKTPDEMVAQAFGERSSPDSDTTIPLDAITYLQPGDLAALKAQANNATAAQMIGANARVMLAEQNAPAVIAATGKYPEEDPTAQDFVQVYGADLGPERFKLFRINTGIGKAYSDMHAASNQAIHAELRDAEPGPDGSWEERRRYEIKVGAAQLIMAAREADPAAYVSQLFRGDAPDWSKVKTPQEIQAAINWVWAAQKQLGFTRTLAVPQDLSDSLGARYVDESVPLQQRTIELSETLKAIRNPEARFTFAGQVFQSALARIRQNAANDPKISPAELEAQEKALQVNLLEMAEHPARVRFDAGSWWQKPLAAANDTVRLMANGATFGQADKFSAGMNSLFSDKSYDELLAAEQAETEDAEDRAGSAGTAANLLGGFVTGHGLQSAGLTFTGKFGAEALGGLRGVFARSATAAADGAVFGGVDAALNGRDIVPGVGSGVVFGLGGNALAEGLNAIGGQVARKLFGGPASDTVVNSSNAYPFQQRVGQKAAAADGLSTRQPSKPPTPEGASDQPVAEGSPGLATERDLTNEASGGQDLHLTYMSHWTAAQRAAADLKVKILTEAATVVSHAVRAGKSARKIFEDASVLIPFGSDIDHMIDLQLGGLHELSNFMPLDASVNRSLGAQIWHQIKDLPIGTVINKVTIGER